MFNAILILITDQHSTNCNYSLSKFSGRPKGHLDGSLSRAALNWDKLDSFDELVQSQWEVMALLSESLGKQVLSGRWPAGCSGYHSNTDY